MPAARGRGDRLPHARGYSEAPDHGGQRQNKIRHRFGRLHQAHSLSAAINGPLDPVPFRQSGQDFRINHVRGQKGIGPAGISGRRHALDLHDQRVPGLCRFDEEGACHGIGPGSAFHTLVVASSGINCGGDDRVAISDPQDRITSTQNIVIACRTEPMLRHVTSPQIHRRCTSYELCEPQGCSDRHSDQPALPMKCPVPWLVARAGRPRAVYSTLRGQEESQV